MSKSFDGLPLIIDIKAMTEKNDKFSTSLWSGKHLQLNLICIPPLSETGTIQHLACDRFLCITQGTGLAAVGKKSTCVDYHCQLHANSSVFIPCGTWINLINTGDTPLQLYSIHTQSHAQKQ